MVLKLDPRYPQVWRSPTSLQFGVASPVVVLHDVTASEEHMIAALTVGISPGGLTMIARGSGAHDAAVPALLRALEPALLSGEGDGSVSTVTVEGEGVTARAVCDALEGEGLAVGSSAKSPSCDLAVTVAHFVLAPEQHGLWLRRDIPHLPVVYNDTTVTIGPVVEPGTGPCLYCLQRYRTDADPAWPAIASQLWGRRSAVETPLVSLEVAAIAGRIVVDRLGSGEPASEHRSITVDARSGAVTTTVVEPHPLCGCTGLGAADPDALVGASRLSVAARPGTDSPGAARRGKSPPRSSRTPPTTGSAFAEPA
jgi:bacteriocin biosynthesis cyclodehydratase domain-containing protein